MYSLFEKCSRFNELVQLKLGAVLNIVVDLYNQFRKQEEE